MIFVSFSCTKKIVEPVKSLNEKLNFDKSEYAEVFKNQFLSMDGYILSQDSILTYFDTLKYFYSLRNFQPLFVKSFEDNDKIFSLIPFLEKVEEHGLNPEQYHFSEIINDFNSAIDTLPNLSRYYLLAMTELLISDAILKYSHHLRYGLVNPKEIFPDTYFLPIDDSSKGDLLQPLREQNLAKYLNDIQPKSKRYLKLIMANETGIILSHIHTGISANAINPPVFSIITNPKLKYAMSAQIKEVKAAIKIVVIFFI